MIRLLFCSIALVIGECAAQLLAPTEQTSFTYPADGWGKTIPFPKYLAQRTNLTDWPNRTETPPFTPDMAISYYTAFGAAIIDDIVEAPYSSECCQTFDDGPTEASSVLVDYLSSFGQKTTYFQIGSQILDGYQVTQRQYSEGHEIAVHTWSHPDLTTLSDEQIYAELQWAIYIIHAAIGQTPKLFRPPFGSIDDRVRTVAATLNLTAVTWSHDSNDWQIGSNENFTHERVIDTVNRFIGDRSSGQILLEHELIRDTVIAGMDISAMVANTGLINAPISAIFGDAQRYQGTGLRWPVVTETGFNGTMNPISGTIVSSP